MKCCNTRCYSLLFPPPPTFYRFGLQPNLFLRPTRTKCKFLCFTLRCDQIWIVDVVISAESRQWQHSSAVWERKQELAKRWKMMVSPAGTCCSHELSSLSGQFPSGRLWDFSLPELVGALLFSHWWTLIIWLLSPTFGNQITRSSFAFEVLITGVQEATHAPARRFLDHWFG